MRAEATWTFVVVALLVSGCRAPDLDAEPGRAQTLALGRVRLDQLDCGRGDCADWYRFEVRSSGDFEAQLVTSDGRTRGTRRITLSDHQGKLLHERSVTGELRTQVSWRVAPGIYFLAVSSDDSRRFQYELLADIRTIEPVSVAPRAKPTPAPEPEPRFEWVEMRLHEINGKLGEPQEVLFYSDRPLDRGLRGRLVRGTQTVAEVTVLAYYPRSGGAKARIDDDLREPISKADTRLEIAIPVERPRRTTSSRRELPPVSVPRNGAPATRGPSGNQGRENDTEADP